MRRKLAALEAAYGWERAAEFAQSLAASHPAMILRWADDRYADFLEQKRRNDALKVVEIAFAIYFVYFLIHELTAMNLLAIPFLTLFAGGFTYVALCSLAQWFPQLRNPWRDSGDALSA